MLFDPRLELGDALDLHSSITEHDLQDLHQKAKQALPSGIPYEIRSKLDATGVAWYYSTEVMISYLDHTTSITKQEGSCVYVERNYSWEQGQQNKISDDGGFYLYGRYIA